MNMRLLLIPSLLCCAIPARAGIEFEKVELHAPAKPDDKEVTADFKFKITGDKVVKITDINPTCSCLKAETKDGRMEYKPGEEGLLHTVFSLGSFEGVVGKQIIVSSSDPDRPEITLTVKAEIPLIYKAEPESITWELNETAAGKKVKFQIQGEKDIQVTGLQSSREGMKAEVKEIKKGREYEITLTPQSTAEPMLGFIRVETDAPYPRHQKKLLFFNIKRAAPPQSR
jgi:Protein of unknown function (DUF1573)